jgi:hypothetical protein
MHLFISFIMRAFMALLRDNLFVDGLDSLALSTDEALVEAASDGVLHQYPGTSGVSISFFGYFLEYQNDFPAGDFISVRFDKSVDLIVSDPLYTVGVQISDELVAVFHHGQLLLDIDGRPLLAQFNFPGAFHRLECHHHLHHPRMGYVFYYYVDENLISLALVGLYRIYAWADV